MALVRSVWLISSGIGIVKKYHANIIEPLFSPSKVFESIVELEVLRNSLR